MALKRYSKKEPQVLAWIIVPYIFLLNLIIFGSCILHSARTFVKSFIYASVFIFCIYFFFGLVAIFIKKRFPTDGQMFKRIAFMLPVFYLMNAASMSWLYMLLDLYNPTGCTPRSGMLLWAIVFGCIMSTFITFINEGVANWETWKVSILETEKLKSAYQRSKVLGLRGQINPHFLFNCFNTLSGLIQEDEEKAETFLNEMTKVHRYLMRGEEELLVSLEQEKKFAESYLYLAKERFGDALQTSIMPMEENKEMLLPPLSLQVILENIIYTNALNKSDPLSIKLSIKKEHLVIENSIHDKKVIQQYNVDDGLDNLMAQYRMLNAGEITVSDNGGSRRFELPLFSSKEELL